MTASYVEQSLASLDITDLDSEGATRLLSYLQDERVKAEILGGTPDEGNVGMRLSIYRQVGYEMDKYMNKRAPDQVFQFTTLLLEQLKLKNDNELWFLCCPVIARSIKYVAKTCELEDISSVIMQLLSSVKCRTDWMIVLFPEFISILSNAMKYFYPDQLAITLVGFLIQLTKKQEEDVHIRATTYHILLEILKYSSAALHKYRDNLISLFLHEECISTYPIPKHMFMFVKLILPRAYCEIEPLIKRMLTCFFREAVNELSKCMSSTDKEVKVNDNTTSCLACTVSIISMLSPAAQRDCLNSFIETCTRFGEQHYIDLISFLIRRSQLKENITEFDPAVCITKLFANNISRPNVQVEPAVITNMKTLLTSIAENADFEEHSIFAYFVSELCLAYISSGREEIPRACEILEKCLKSGISNMCSKIVKNTVLCLEYLLNSNYTKIKDIVEASLILLHEKLPLIAKESNRFFFEESCKANLYLSKIYLKILAQEVKPGNDIKELFARYIQTHNNDLMKILSDITREEIIRTFEGIQFNDVIESFKKLGANMIVDASRVEEFEMSIEQSNYRECCSLLLFHIKYVGKMMGSLITEDSPLLDLFHKTVYLSTEQESEKFRLNSNLHMYSLANMKNVRMRAFGNHNKETLDFISSFLPTTFLSTHAPLITASRVESTFITTSLMGYLLYAYSGVSFQYLHYFNSLFQKFTGTFLREKRCFKHRLFPFCSPGPLIQSFAHYYDETGDIFGIWESEIAFLNRNISINSGIPEITALAIRREYDFHKESFGIMGNDAVFELLRALYVYILQTKARVVARDAALLGFSVETFCALFEEFKEGLGYVCLERSYGDLLNIFSELRDALSKGSGGRKD